MNFLVALYLLAFWHSTTAVDLENEIEKKELESEPPIEEKSEGPVPCTCGVFLSGQFKKGSKEQPKGIPVLTQETEKFFPNNAIGNRQCMNNCLEVIIKFLPKSADIICATAGRDCHKERAYLFIQNFNSVWQNTNMSAGREFCCKDNAPYKCPLT